MYTLVLILLRFGWLVAPVLAVIAIVAPQPSRHITIETGPVGGSYHAAALKYAVWLKQHGLKVKLKAHSEYQLPEELKKKLDSMPRLKKAFNELTPGRQRGYMFHIASAKLAKTREARVEKCVEPILAGKGLDD